MKTEYTIHPLHVLLADSIENRLFVVISHHVTCQPITVIKFYQRNGFLQRR